VRGQDIPENKNKREEEEREKEEQERGIDIYFDTLS
jgi:hypothetical protein